MEPTAIMIKPVTARQPEHVWTNILLKEYVRRMRNDEVLLRGGAR